MSFNSQRGKEAGSKSKRGNDKQSEAIRIIFTSILNNNTNNLQEWIDKVAKDNPAKAIELILKMSNYVLPKLRQTELQSEALPDTMKVIVVKAKDEIKQLKQLKLFNENNR
jgi:hypothetical protein